MFHQHRPAIEHDLVDERYLHGYPRVLGRGKRVFPDAGLDRRSG